MVAGGECLSKKELSVEEDLLSRGSSLVLSLVTSLLDVLPELEVEVSASVTRNELLDLRRMLRSLRKEGIAAGAPAKEEREDVRTGGRPDRWSHADSVSRRQAGNGRLARICGRSSFEVVESAPGRT
nr:hypothetical protein CFP56_38926 [Quercus suber]